MDFPPLPTTKIPVLLVCLMYIFKYYTPPSSIDEIQLIASPSGIEYIGINVPWLITGRPLHESHTIPM